MRKFLIFLFLAFVSLYGFGAYASQPFGLNVGMTPIKNLIKNPNTTGAVNGSPGTLPTNWTLSGNAGLTVTVVGTGVANGIPWIDIRFNGTTNATGFSLRFQGSGGNIVTNVNPLTMTLYAAYSAGALTNITSAKIGYDVFNSSSGYITSDTSAALTLTSDLTKFKYVHTTETNAYRINPYFIVATPNGAAVDVTFRLAIPSVVTGSY